MTNLGTATLYFKGDDSDIERSLGRVSRTVEREGGKIEGSLKKSLATGGRAGGGSFVREMKGASRKAGSALQTGMRNVAKGIKSQFKNIGTGIGQGIGQRISSGLIGVVGSIGSAVFDIGNLSAFDAASNKVATLSNDVEGLKSASFQLADELGNTVSATETLNASYDVLSAGFSKTSDVMAILKASQKGAIGGFSDLNTVANATTSVLNAYGLSAEKAAEIVDQMAGTQNAGKITIAEYASQIGKLASTSAQAGVELVEVNAIIAAATAKGVRVSSAFDGLRQAIAAMLKPSKQASDLAEDLGVQFDAAGLRSKGLVGILRDLGANATPDNLVKLFGSVEAVAAIAPIAGKGLQDYEKALATINATSADASFNQVASGLENQTKAIQNTLQDLDVSLKSGAFGQAVASGLSLVNNALKTTINWFKALDPEAQRVAGIGSAIAVALGAVSAVVIGVIAFLGSGLVAAISAAAAAAAPFIAAAAAIVGVIAAISAGVAAAINWWDGLSDAQKEATRESQPIQAAIGDTIDAVRALGQWLADNAPLFISWAQAAIGAVVSIVQAYVRHVANVIAVLNRIIVTWRNVTQAITGAVTAIISTVVRWATQTVGAIQSQINQFGLVGAAVNTLRALWDKAFTTAAQLIKKADEATGGFVSAAIKGFKAVIVATNPLLLLLTNIGKVIKTVKGGLKAIAKFLPGKGGGEGGGNPLTDLLGILKGGVPATTPGQADVITPFGGRVTDLASTTPHHSYQRTLIGLARDVTLLKNNSTRVAVPSPLSGVVEQAGPLGGYGNAVIVRSLDGMRTLLGHFESVVVKVGQQVQFGQSLGIQGSTGRSSGPHVHIEAAEKVIDRWLKFITGTGEFAVNQGARGGGDPITVKENFDHAGHNHPPGVLRGGQGGARLERVFKDLKKRVESDLKELATIQKKFQNDEKLGVLSEAEAKKKTAEASKKYLADLEKHKALLQEFSVGDTPQAQDARALIERIRSKEPKPEKPNQAASDRLTSIKDAIAATSAEIALAEKRLSTDVALGLVDKVEAEKQLLGLREKSVMALEAYVKQLKDLGNSTESAEIKLESGEAIEAIRAFQVAVKETSKEIERSQLEAIAEKVSRAQDEISIAQQRGQNDVALGINTEEEALARVLALRTEMSDLLSRSLPDLALFMATASDPRAVLNAQQLVEEIRSISAETARQREAADQAGQSASDIQKLNESLTSIGRSAKDSIFDALIEGGRNFGAVLEDIGKQLAKLALNFLFSSLFKGGSGGGGGLGAIFGFKNGGRIPNFAQGGIAGTLNSIGSALTREGPGAVLAALTPGEQVLSKRNGDAQAFRRFQADGTWAAMRQTANFMQGGPVGNTSTPTARSAQQSSTLPAFRVDRINQVDYVSMDQLREAFAIRDPQLLAQADAQSGRNLTNSNYRRAYGVR